MTYKVNFNGLYEKLDKLWLKRDHRPMSNVFICPHCARECYCNNPIQDKEKKTRANICSYKFCPYCGKIVYGSEV